MAARSLLSWLKSTEGARRKSPKRSRSRRSLLGLESLEERLVPTVIIGDSDLNPANWTISGDGDGNDRAFFGTPFITAMVNGVPSFYMSGSVMVPDGTEMGGLAQTALVVGGDFTLGQNVFINFAADGASPGPGGARRATGARAARAARVLPL